MVRDFLTRSRATDAKISGLGAGLDHGGGDFTVRAK